MDTKASPQPKVLNVVVLHWEDSIALERCLAHISESDYPHLRVVVAENGSSEQQRTAAERIIAQCRAWFRELLFLQLEQNLGYAGGINATVSYLATERRDGDLCILNPDVCVKRQTFSVMMDALTDKVGMVMCRTVSERGTLLYDALKLSGFRQRHIVSKRDTVESDYAQGACFIVRRTLVTEDLFDERFFLYWEEVDLAFRVRSAGFRIVSATKAEVVRQKNDTARLPNAVYYSARNASLMLAKYPGRFSQAGYLLYCASLLAIACKLVHRPRMFLQAVSGVFAGIDDGRAGRYGKRVPQPTLVKRTEKAAAILPISVHEEGGMK